MIRHKAGELCLDIAGAYPAEAAVKSWKRTVTAMKSGISVTEDYELSDFIAPPRLMFIALSADALDHIQYDKTQLSAEVEDISNQLDPLLKGMWGEQMFRIILTVKSNHTKNQIKYTIR